MKTTSPRFYFEDISINVWIYLHISLKYNYLCMWFNVPGIWGHLKKKIYEQLKGADIRLVSTAAKKCRKHFECACISFHYFCNNFKECIRFLLFFDILFWGKMFFTVDLHLSIIYVNSATCAWQTVNHPPTPKQQTKTSASNPTHFLEWALRRKLWIHHSFSWSQFLS